METVKRKRFEGISNILKFNWHFYALAFGLVFLWQLCRIFLPPSVAFYAAWLQFFTAFSTVLSLAASYYIYDRSNLYTFDWLGAELDASGARVLNLHAGFDEISFLLAGKYQEIQLQVFDFYDPQMHTEVSIKRARKAASVYPGTIPISTAAVPVPPGSADVIFTFLAAHEIRNSHERATFFRALQESLKPDGRIVVVEHLRDLPNFLVYNFGAFHFLPETEWKQTFHSAGLRIEKERKITPFVSAYFLQKNGNPS